MSPKALATDIRQAIAECLSRYDLAPEDLTDPERTAAKMFAHLCELAETDPASSPISFTEDNLAAYIHDGRETFVYLDGQFYNRTTKTPQQMAEALSATVMSVEAFPYPPCGLALPGQRTCLASLRLSLQSRR